MARRSGWGRRAAVTGSVALMGAVLLGVPAYESSVRSAALANQIAEGCLTDMGVRSIVFDRNRLDEQASELGSVGDPLVTTWSHLRYHLPNDPEGPTRRAVMLYRPGQFDEVIATAVPGPGEVLVPEWMTTSGDIGTGMTVTAEPDPRGAERADIFMTPADLRIVGTYETIPTRPEPAFWCSFRDELRFSSFGDPPPPLLLATPETFELFSATASFDVWEISPDPDGLRIDEAEDTFGRLNELQLAENRLNDVPLADDTDVGLGTPLRRGLQVGAFVSLTIAPLRYAGVVMALVLVIGSSIMVARAERRELRLRALRGVGPIGLAAGELRWLAPTSAVGAAIGGLLGWLAVRRLGPFPQIEPSALRTGAIGVVVGWVVAMLVAAVVIGVHGTASVDPKRRRFHVDGRILFEVGIVALAVWSFVRLDTYGGVRQIGVEVRGGDLLAQAFPLVGAMALVVVLGRPLLLVVRGMRRVGGRLPMPLLLGLRRVTFEPAATVSICLATALATAVAFQASALTASVEQLLDDKASTFVGADVAIYVIGTPPSAEGLGSAATEVIRLPSDDRSVRFMGIDPDTFAPAVRWRDDAADASLDELMATLAADPFAAIAVDPDGAIDLGPHTFGIRRDDVEFDVVATARFFPGYSSGAPMLVVHREALDDRGERAILIADPVPDAAGILARSGGNVSNVTSIGEIFDGTNYLSARWSYDTLRAFAVMLGLVTLVGQVLVLEARLRARRVAHVLTRPMGMTTRQEYVAGLVEVGAPLATGVVTGGLIGWFVSRLAITRLDALRLRQPPARLVVEIGSVVVAVVVIAVVAACLAAVGAVRTTRHDAAEVMRVAES